MRFPVSVLALFILSLTIFQGCGQGSQDDSRILPANISPQQLKERMATDTEMILIDIRPIAEKRQSGWIDWADGTVLYQVTLETLDSLATATIRNKNTPIVVYGADAEKAIEILKSQEFDNIATLTGGWEAWLDAYPLFTTDPSAYPSDDVEPAVADTVSTSDCDGKNDDDDGG